jgi:hypothetical protein
MPGRLAITKLAFGASNLGSNPSMASIDCYEGD